MKTLYCLLDWAYFPKSKERYKLNIAIIPMQYAFRISYLDLLFDIEKCSKHILLRHFSEAIYKTNPAL